MFYLHFNRFFICKLRSFDIGNSKFSINDKYQKALEDYAKLTKAAMSRISSRFSTINCDELFSDNANKKQIKNAKSFIYDFNKTQLIFKNGRQTSNMTTILKSE